MHQRKTARTAPAAPAAQRHAPVTPRVEAQRRLGDAINAGPAAARLATMDSLANGVVQRQDDEDQGSARSPAAVSGAVTSGQGASGFAGATMSTTQAPAVHPPPQANAAAAAAPAAGAAAAHGSRIRLPAVAAIPALPPINLVPPAASGGASGSALASGSQGTMVSAAAAAAAAAGAAGGVAPSPEGQMHAPIPIPAGIGGAARHAMPNLLFASHAAGAPPEEGSLYYADGTRVRMVHADGPYVSTQPRDRHTLGPDGQLHPAAAGQGGKLLEFQHGMIGATPALVSHTSRGGPAAPPVQDPQQLAQIAAVASAATPAIAAAKAVRDHAPRGTSEHARAEGDYIGQLNHYNAMMRDVVHNPPPGLAAPAAGAAAAGGHAPYPGAGAAAPPVISASAAASHAVVADAAASAAPASGSASSSAPVYSQPQPVPANAAAAAAAAPAAGIERATAAARDALLLIGRAHLATIDARSRTGPPAGGAGAGGAGGKPPAA